MGKEKKGGSYSKEVAVAAASLPAAAAVTSARDALDLTRRVRAAKEVRNITQGLQVGDHLFSGRHFASRKSMLKGKVLANGAMIETAAEIGSGGSLRHSMPVVKTKEGVTINRKAGPFKTRFEKNRLIENPGGYTPSKSETKGSISRKNRLVSGGGIYRSLEIKLEALSKATKGKGLAEKIKKYKDNIKLRNRQYNKTDKVTDRRIKSKPKGSMGIVNSYDRHTPKIHITPRKPLTLEEKGKVNEFLLKRKNTTYDVDGAVSGGTRRVFFPRLFSRGGKSLTGKSGALKSYHCGSLGAASCALVGRGPLKDVKRSLPSDLLMNKKDYKIVAVNNRKAVIADISHGLKMRNRAHLKAGIVMAAAGFAGGALIKKKKNEGLKSPHSVT